MIRTPFLGKITALAMAIATHGALAFVLTAQTHAPMTKGADAASEVRLGNSFQDLASGTLIAQQPLEAESAARQIVGAAPQMAAPIMPDGMMSLTSQETITSEAGGADSPALSNSARPEPKRKAPPTRRTPAKQPTKEVQATRNAAVGNAPEQTRAGEARGIPESVSTRSGSGDRQESAGSAAASNYPGLVMKKLSRAGKPNVSARGATLIAFSIADNGALAALSVARGSGSSELDKAALRLVQAAAPFPPPPHGARRNLSIEIKGR